MTQSFMYWPYDEVTISTTADGQTLLVQTPWIEAKIPNEGPYREKFEMLADKFAQQSLGGEDLPLINWFFSQLSDYPLCYTLPGLKGEGDLDQHTIQDDKLLALSMNELLALILKSSPGESFTASDLVEVTRYMARTEWTWDADAAFAFAATEEKIHPESIFSVARRFHILDVLDNDQGTEVFAKISELKGEAFVKAAGKLVRQNHYVTQHCRDALAPAKMTGKKAGPLVEAFMKQEDGHDLILGVAMKSFAGDPENIPVTPSTKALMRLLGYAAGRNFLGFAMAVDFFERSNYKEVDPMAELLINGGFEKAAKQINRHMEINDAGGHENVAGKFLEFMDLTPKDYALEALRIAELTTVVMNSITSSVWPKS